MIYGQMGWEGLIVWLPLLCSGAYALYHVVQARGEVTQRLGELSDANTRMSGQSRREAHLATQLIQASGELTGYAARLEGALYQQHTSIAQITSTVEQLAQQAGYIAETARTVDDTSEAALATAGEGQQAAANSMYAIEELERSVQEIKSRMTALEGRSRLIHRTLQTINNIANETHLLALNATIEAAGAGDRGRRFAVVAGQVNALADQAMRAADEIQLTVREIEAATADTKGVIERGLSETRRYTGQLGEARRSMDVILGAVGRVSEMAQQIRYATEQQTQASTQVTDTMREIARAMGLASNEGSAVHTAAEHLRQIADELRQENAAVLADLGNGHHPDHAG
jgi:methyl-accepting chemotaxis protein